MKFDKKSFLLIGQKIKSLGWATPRMYFSLIFISLVLVVWWQNRAPTTKKVQQKTHPAALATYLPRGYQLIEVEVRNTKYLDSILGQYGIVDLYIGAKLIAQNLRMLRSPVNPSHFGVQVPDKLVKRFLHHKDVFTVTVKSPKASGTEFVRPIPKKRQKRTITIGSDL